MSPGRNRPAPKARAGAPDDRDRMRDVRAGGTLVKLFGRGGDSEIVMAQGGGTRQRPEARQHERIGSWLVCRVYTAAGDGPRTYQGLLTNVSEGGAAVISPAAAVMQAAEVYVELALDGTRQLVPCTVIAAAELPGLVQLRLSFRYATERQERFVQSLIRALRNDGLLDAMERAAA